VSAQLTILKKVLLLFSNTQKSCEYFFLILFHLFSLLCVTKLKILLHSSTLKLSNAVQKGPDKLRDSKCPKAKLKYFFGLKNIKPTLAPIAKASMARDDQILNIYLYFLIILYFWKILLLLNLIKTKSIIDY
jgi:hypothetical protein